MADEQTQVRVIDAVEARRNMMEVDEAMGGLSHLPKITGQQRAYVAARVGGMTCSEAARSVGATPRQGRTWEKETPEVEAWLEHYWDVHTTEVMPKIRFGKAEAHAMYMEAYQVAATAGEKIKATDALVKLHRVNEHPAEKVITVKDIRNVKQLTDLTIEQLAQLAQMEDVIEGDVVDETSE